MPASPFLLSDLLFRAARFVLIEQRAPAHPRQNKLLGAEATAAPVAPLSFPFPHSSSHSDAGRRLTPPAIARKSIPTERAAVLCCDAYTAREKVCAVNAGRGAMPPIARTLFPIERTLGLKATRILKRQSFSTHPTS
ncbi:hypothetical protein PtA15_10A148 [Puccinia triticina]|uniref:Uncharacterized protein n=1 Tax=Puccinia triticina TaxID=208348 RepID=A0ABY7CTZ5_9BASI|nr:uncharacterized protein PtA15_10A148 [Puccinia triticina]WAQ88729.1 hypothetical protein PtA15_10A148 [Puccinia triticina]WAR58796.1 hypothetical protein PtB15_10B135 [Puccinia triticina]